MQNRRVHAWLLLSFLTLHLLACAPAPTLSNAQRESRLQELDESPSPSEELHVLLEETLRRGREQRIMSSERNAAWQIMHGVVCYGNELEIETPDRGLVKALDYALTGGLINGFELSPGHEILPATNRVGVKARLEPGSYVGQGHVDQWIAILAMCDYPIDAPIQLGEKTFTVEDFARQAQFDVTDNPLDEFSWTLIALTHYFPNEPAWTAAEQTQVNWEAMVAVELDYEIDLSPCGGTHRLAGIVRALRAKERLGLPDSEVWSDAEQLVARCLEDVRQYRSADGRLSSSYFISPGHTADLAAELSSTGHLFEFVALACSESELESAWVEQSARKLCELLDSTAAVDLDCGALYHALSGLKIYHNRRFGSARDPAANS